MDERDIENRHGGRLSHPLPHVARMDSSDQISSTTPPAPVDPATSPFSAAGPRPTSRTSVVASGSSADPGSSSCATPTSGSGWSTSNTADTNARSAAAVSNDASADSRSHASLIGTCAGDMSPGSALETSAPTPAVFLAPGVSPPSSVHTLSSNTSEVGASAASITRVTAAAPISPAPSHPEAGWVASLRPPAAASSASSATGSDGAVSAGTVGSAAASSVGASTSSTALAVVVIGMAGSGKSTFVGGLQRHLAAAGKRVYTINLDPAAVTLPYESVNIDIRDTVNYKRVMQHYRLGPNGGILTALNLFATKFGDVLTLLEQRKQTHDYILLDTPGQIEAFTWSASGSIILESLAASLPTCICYVLDTPRCTRPVTFMSNMLYSCSVLYKARLPFIGVFNKTDVTSHLLCQKWMTDYEAFQEALLTDDTYLASLSRSSALMLVEFYSIIQTAGVSSVTNAGMKGLEQLLDKCRNEYETDFLPFLREKRKANEAKAKARAETQFDKFMKDHSSSASSRPAEKAAQRLTTNSSAAAEGSPTCTGMPDGASVKRSYEEAQH